MGGIDIVIIAVIVAAIGGALYYLWRAKKRGSKCVGCPYCDSCSKKSCTDEYKTE